jgi:GNAT superfamily N-acetyltransferase
MECFIRTAALKDAELISELCNQLGYEATPDQVVKRLTHLLNHSDYCVFVVSANETIIGWIHGFYSLRVESDPFVEIGGMVIDEKYRNKGVGRLLIKKVTEWAHLKECNHIRVRCNIFRKETHQFYHAMGFYEMKEQKVFGLLLR